MIRYILHLCKTVAYWKRIKRLLQWRRQAHLRNRSRFPAKSLPVSLPSVHLSQNHTNQCVVTGANRGIGLGIADCCLSNDAQAVYSIDIGETGDEFKAVSDRYPGKMHAIKADVTNEASITDAVDNIIKEAGGLHGFVVNAGRTKHKPALDFTTEEIEQLWSVNVRSISSSEIEGLLTSSMP